MADNSNPYANLGTVSPEIYQQQQDLNRQQRMAEMLMQNNQQPQGQMIGNRFVAPSWAAQLAPVVSQLAGAYIGKNADEKALEYAKLLHTQGNEDLQNVMNNLSGKPAQMYPQQAGPMPNGGNIPLQEQTPAIPANPRLALAQALSSQSPQVKALIPSLIQNTIPKKTDEMLNFEAAKSDGFKGSFTDYKNKMNDYQKEELKISAGRLAVDQAKAAFEMQNGKPLNESQAKAAVFHSQMVGASNELNNVYAKGFNPNSPVAQTQTNMAGSMFNAVTPASAQQAKQAQNQWTEAYLRFKTGAGTNAHEVEANRKTYFPDFGDKPDQIAQKARMRAQAEQDIAMAAGPQGGKMGAQPNSAVIPIATPTQQITPNLWGPATVVK